MSCRIENLNMILKFILVLLFYCYFGGVQGRVTLRSSGPTVLGASLTVSATALSGYSGAQFKYVFRNVEKNKRVEIVSSRNVVNHTVKISRDEYDVGLYAFEVSVYRKHIFKRHAFVFVGSDRIIVPITDFLNGQLKLMQNGIDKTYGRILPNVEVNHVIELSKEEQQFLTDDNKYIVYWYLDCSLISSTGLSFDYTYENTYKTYNLEALVEVEHKTVSNSTSSSTPEGFKCAPVYSVGHTYGYYKASVRVEATDSSPSPVRATSEDPSNSWNSNTEHSVYNSGGDERHLRLESSGPTVRGADLTLTAIFTDDYPGVERKYVFRNVRTQWTVETLSKNSTVECSFKLSKEKYEAGRYHFEARVYDKNEHVMDSDRYLSRDIITVPVTELLNVKLKMIQNGFDRSYGRIFPNEQVSHIIELSPNEHEFLTDIDNNYLVHWYVDCSLISSTGLYLNHTYEDPAKTYVLEALVEVEHKPNSQAAQVSGWSNKLASFKCAPIHGSGYTYGYYKIKVRADATDGSPPPPSATPEIPSSKWEDSRSPDSASESSPRTWRTTPTPTWRDHNGSWNSSPSRNYTNKPWRNWWPTENFTHHFDSGDHKNCSANANNAVLSIKDGHIKIAMDLVFHGVVNITNLQIERN